MTKANRTHNIIAAMAVALTTAAMPSVAFAQTSQAVRASVSDNNMARSADTVSDDLRLINRCIDNGRSKSECLCVTQVMKYEMSLSDYRRAARAYDVKVSMVSRGNDPFAGPAARVESDITAMVSSPNFDYRCAAARDYFARRR